MHIRLLADILFPAKADHISCLCDVAGYKPVCQGISRHMFQFPHVSSHAGQLVLHLQVGSTILAQAAGVPTLPWSGSDVSISYQDCGGTIPADVYDKACIHSVDEALSCCQHIEYPCMLKASWGGGGKGIRKVQTSNCTWNMQDEAVIIL